MRSIIKVLLLLRRNVRYGPGSVGYVLVVMLLPPLGISGSLARASQLWDRGLPKLFLRGGSFLYSEWCCSAMGKGKRSDD